MRSHLRLAGGGCSCNLRRPYSHPPSSWTRNYEPSLWPAPRTGVPVSPLPPSSTGVRSAQKHVSTGVAPFRTGVLVKGVFPCTPLPLCSSKGGNTTVERTNTGRVAQEKITSGIVGVKRQVNVKARTKTSASNFVATDMMGLDHYEFESEQSGVAHLQRPVLQASRQSDYCLH